MLIFVDREDTLSLSNAQTYDVHDRYEKKTKWPSLSRLKLNIHTSASRKQRLSVRTLDASMSRKCMRRLDFR